MDLRWEDTRDILRQLESVFQSEDTDLVASIAQRGAEILTIVAERKENIQTSIRELARQVHGERAEEDGDRLNGGPSAASRVHNAAMARLQSGYEAVDATLGALKREEAHLQEQIASVAAEDKQTALAAARLEDARNAEIPRVKHTISLYSNISHIRWDTESRKVTGCVIPPQGGPMKAFDIDPAKASEYDIANTLWDLIGTATRA